MVSQSATHAFFAQLYRLEANGPVCGRYGGAPGRVNVGATWPSCSSSAARLKSSGLVVWRIGVEHRMPVLPTSIGGRVSIRLPVTIMPVNLLDNKDSICCCSRAGSSRASQRNTEICAGRAYLNTQHEWYAGAPITAVVMSPTVKLRPRIRLWARSLGRNPSRQRPSVPVPVSAGRSFPWPFNALETVPIVTPASRAHSWIVTTCWGREERLLTIKESLMFFIPLRKALSTLFLIRKGFSLALLHRIPATL